MSRVDRVLGLFDERWTLGEAVGLGVTEQDAEDAAALARLDLELERALSRPWVAELIACFLDDLCD